ncbi:MAG TPA: CBS domain-containing protein [Blastocatellia bacterium]|nr:CBS domain-containing protein [Blastocatellia bacterium]
MRDRDSRDFENFENNDVEWRNRNRYDRDDRFTGQRNIYGRETDYGRESNLWGSADRDYDPQRYNDYGVNRNFGNLGSTGDTDYDRDRYGYRNRQYGTTGRTQYSHLRARDIMTTDVRTTTPDASIFEVAKMMRDEDVGAIPVIENGKLKGIVTDRDIVIRAIADKNQNLGGFAVKDVMSDDVYSVRPNDRVVDAIRKMGDKQVRRILVTDNNDRLRGIISMADVALESDHDRELAEALEDVSEHKSWFKRLFSW